MKKTIINASILISFIILILCVYFIYDENKSWNTSNLDEVARPNPLTSKPLNFEEEYEEYDKHKEYKVMDFSLIHQDNEEVIAWLEIYGTKINYPIVQGKDNNYYVEHSIKKEKSKAGCLFLDYRVHGDFTDFNNIIYGHNMKNGDMFGELIKFKEQDFFENNSVAWLYTPKKSYKLDIFSYTITESTSDYYKYTFTSLSDKNNFIDMLKNTSIKWRDVNILPDDSIIIFSTCSYEYNNARIVVCAVIHH